MRRLTRFRFASLLLCGLAAAPSPLAAQQGRARVQSAETSRPQVPARESRPEAQPLHVEAVPPELEAVLTEWFGKTQGIKKLQGEHVRWTYDTVFTVAKISRGRFYYEGPDKGRIDVTPEPVQQNQTVKGPGGIVFNVKPDTPERWVCDGEQILKIDEATKEYEVLPIPAEHRGANIMDSALPFLFGMPPAAAKQRYSMKLVSRDETAVFLEIRPKKKVDAANWQRADVKLDAKTFLPTAVQLIDPAGNGITVFKFEETQVNPNKILEIFKGNPFKPILIAYRQAQSPAGGAAQPLDLKGKPITGMPAVVGLQRAEALKVLGARGFKTVKVDPGPITDKPELSLCVAEQTPGPGADAKPGEAVQLTLYVTEEDIKKYNLKPGPVKSAQQ